MKTTTLFVLVLPFIAGCLPAIDGQNFYLSESAKAQLSQACDELRDIGNLRNVREGINQDMAQIKELIKTDDLESVRDQINNLKDQIQDQSEKLLRLTDARYTTADSTQRLKWQLGSTELGLGTADKKSLWKIANVQIEKIYDWRGESKDLFDFTQLNFNPSSILVRFQRPASALEICQLQQTIVVVLKVDYRGPFSNKTMHYKLLAQNLRKP